MADFPPTYGESPSSSGSDLLFGADLLVADSEISDLDLSHPDSIPCRSPLYMPRQETRPRPKLRLQNSSQSAAPAHASQSRRPPQTKRVDSRLVNPMQYAARPVPELGPDRWDTDAEMVDALRLPLHPDESQQDLAERINTLTRRIHANTQLCLEVSGRMINLAKENKHLCYSAGASISTYVLQPCLKAGHALRTYYPGGLQALHEYELQLRRAVAKCANGRNMALIGTAVAGGIGGSKSRAEVDRLKDRLIEQDALLRDSSSHMQRLMRERDALKEQLKARGPGPRAGEPGSPGARPDSKSSTHTPHKTTDRDVRRVSLGEHDALDQLLDDVKSDQSTALADQVRELRLQIDQFALQGVRKPQLSASRKANISGQVNIYDGDDSNAQGSSSEDGLDNDGDWTLV